jgi:predicted Zn finger-like uncharacterized protein
MRENWIRVTCPDCLANYRVDPDEIPEQGGSAACKKCGRTFAIRKPAANPLTAEPSAVSGVLKSQPDELFTCPKCGHRQPQPFTCYACGAGITPQPTDRDTAPAPAPAPAVAPERPPGTGLLSGLETGKIIIRARYKSPNFLFSMARPRISIEGMDYTRNWGAHALDVPVGDYSLSVDVPFFFGSLGRGTIQVRASSAEKAFIDCHFKNQAGSAVADIRRASLAEGTLWPIHAEPKHSSGRGSSSRKGVIISLILMGPLGLIPLWKSEHFSSTVKIAITAAMGLIAVLIMSKL